MKRIYRKFKLFLWKIKFKHSEKIKILKKYKEKVLIVLDTPEHGNLGDQAIFFAEKKFLQDNYSDFIIVNFSFNECKYCSSTIKKSANSDCIFFIQGGGFIGSLWPNEQENVVLILKYFNNRKVIIFPQTLYFYDHDEIVLNEFINVVKKCSNLSFFVRDKNSYLLLKKHSISRCYLIPDMVLYLNKFNKEKNGKVLCCFRNDKEKINNFDYIIEILKSHNIEYDITDTVIKKDFNFKFAEQLLSDKLDEFSKYSLVLCDRLHAMIFSAVTGTPCIAFDNISKKVSGVYSWISEVNYVKCLYNEKVNYDIINDFLHITPINYYEGIIGKYDILKEAINDYLK